MFTPLQFSQLVASAWSGPAASRFATISHYTSAAGDYTTTNYSVSYHPHGATGTCFQAAQPCPFATVRAALLKAWQEFALTAEQLHSGHDAVTAAEQAFSNAQPPQVAAACAALPATAPRFFSFATAAPAPIQCAACGCDGTTDPFGVGCDCVWATMRQPVSAHA